MSNGHGSMLLYAVLHLAGFGIDMEDIANFRQLGSPTPGHPEIERHLGIETTTGPLGQGFGTAVGMAVAEARLRAVFGADLVDHTTYRFVSDGDLMEGVSSEAASLAGHLGLGSLVLRVRRQRDLARGPHRLDVLRGRAGSVRRLRMAHRHCRRTRPAGGGRGDHRCPSRGGPAVADRLQDPHRLRQPQQTGHRRRPRESARGGRGGVRARQLGWDLPPFQVPDQARAFFASAMLRGRDARAAWLERRQAAFASDAEIAARWLAYSSRRRCISTRRSTSRTRRWPPG